MHEQPPTSQYVYGPVPSRRLGRSLGVDLVPFKTCTYDCVYCQLGRTSTKTVDRRSWVDPEEVLKQVRARVPSSPDVIALAGSGEPTLHDGIGEVIASIKGFTDIPVVVITNGSLLGLAEVQRDLAPADIVLPSLDAPDEELFQLVNRPHASLRLARVLDGMIAFRRTFAGRIWLEVMLLGGVTGMDAEVERLAALVKHIAPDRIQLNTVVRPPAELFAEPVPADRLHAFAAAFTPCAEVIAVTAAAGKGAGVGSLEVLALLQRRPCTVADIASGLGIHHGEALKAAAALVAAGAAEERLHEGCVFYATTTDAVSKEEQ